VIITLLMFVSVIYATIYRLFTLNLFSQQCVLNLLNAFNEQIN
jgi:hypothetical protein